MMVYEAINQSAEVLYVGFTTNLDLRMSAHVGKPWFREMQYLRLTVFGDRIDAFNFEGQRIKETRAPHNKACNPAWDDAAKGKGDLAKLAKQALAMPNCPEV